MASTKSGREGAYIPEQSPLQQSRKLDETTVTTKQSPFAKSWPHLVAGAYVLVFILDRNFTVLYTFLSSFWTCTSQVNIG
jgi:hypothetical protein